MTRRAPRLVALAALGLILGRASPALADEISVPVPLQADLMAKVAAYDRNLAARAGERVNTLVVFKAGDAESARAAQQLKAALGAKPAIAGLPHQEEVAAFQGAKELAAACREKRLSIVYLAPGFTDAELAQVAQALDGVDVLTAGAVARFVSKGVVLGFDLVSGKPKLLVALGQAGKQKVALSADVLRLMTVYP